MYASPAANTARINANASETSVRQTFRLLFRHLFPGPGQVGRAVSSCVCLRVSLALSEQKRWRVKFYASHHLLYVSVYFGENERPFRLKPNTHFG